MCILRELGPRLTPVHSLTLVCCPHYCTSLSWASLESCTVFSGVFFVPRATPTCGGRCMHACAGCRCMLTRQYTLCRIWCTRIDMYARLFLVFFWWESHFWVLWYSLGVKTVLQNDGKSVLVPANRKTILTSWCTWLCIFMHCILVIAWKDLWLARQYLAVNQTEAIVFPMPETQRQECIQLYTNPTPKNNGWSPLISM